MKYLAGFIRSYGLESQGEKYQNLGKSEKSMIKKFFSRKLESHGKSGNFFLESKKSGKVREKC